MLVYLFILISSAHTEPINTTTAVYNLTKCCDFDSAFIIEDSNYYCNKSGNVRVFVETDLVFDYHMQWGECIESVDSHLYAFKVRNNKFIIVDDMSDKILPKCCPRGYSYEPTIYSCTIDSNNTFFNSKFINVGLPNCKIIYDYEFDSMDDFKIYKNYIDLVRLGEKITNGEYCIDETTQNSFVVRVCKNNDFCKRVQCVHKCCFDGQSFVNGSHCTDTYVYGIDVKRLSKMDGNYSNHFGIIHGYDIGVYIPKESHFYLDELGNFHSYEEKIGKNIYSFEEETYCIEHATKNGIIYGSTLFRIIPHIDIEKKFLFNRWAMLISCFFLILTILFYIVSREASKVFGKILISFCTALLVLLMLIAYNTFFKINLDKGRTVTLCKTIGFLLIYLGFSSFVWLQIMCYDIYWTLGSTKRFTSSHEKRKKDIKRFIYYSLYGWGLPFILTIVPLIFHFVDILPAPISVKMAERRCLIEKDEGNYAEILFYISPLTVIQLVNSVFFTKTVRYCLQVKGDIQKMNQFTDPQKRIKFRAQKEKFGLIIKLSVTMGIFFLFEVVSSFYDFKNNSITEYIELIWDFINCLQGLFIFIIFVCKAKYFKKCGKNISVEKLRKISLTSNSTKVTGMSSERQTVQDSRRK